MLYAQFRDSLLTLIYDQQIGAQGQFLSLSEVLTSKFEENSKWLHRFLDEVNERNYLQVNKTLGSLREWVVRMKPNGFDYVETNLFHQPTSLPSPSSITFQDEANAEVVKNDELIITLDRDAPTYAEIRANLAGLAEELRGTNYLPIATAERERLSASLAAAQTLWDAAELKLVQIKIGVILAIEDAASALKKIGKGVGSALIVDAVKALVKQKTGLDI